MWKLLGYMQESEVWKPAKIEPVPRWHPLKGDGLASKNINQAGVVARWLFLHLDSRLFVMQSLCVFFIPINSESLCHAAGWA